MQGIDLILHIGAGKTGSSAIQTFLRQNHAALADMGFAVPDVDLKFTRRITGHHVFTLQKYIDDQGDGLYHRLNHMMQSRPQPTVVLSAENLSNPDNFRFFKRICSEYRTAVVFYMRRQDDYFSSAWQQWFSKVRADLDRWLADAQETMGHWYSIACGWDHIADKFFPRIFERDLLPNGDVVRDFIAVLGIPDAHELACSEIDVNPSHSNVITSVFAGRRDLFETAHDDRFYTYVSSLTGGKYVGAGNISLITRAQRETIIEHFSEENELLRSKYFPGREHLFSPLDHTKYRYAEEIDLSTEQIRFLVDVVSAAFLANPKKQRKS